MIGFSALLSAVKAAPTRLLSGRAKNFQEWSSFWANPVGGSWMWGRGASPDDPLPQDAAWLSATQRCIGILSDALATPGFGVVQWRPGGGRRTIENSDAARALASLSYEMKESLFSQMLLVGNAYARVVRNAAGRVSSFEVINSGLVQVAVSDAGDIWYRIAEDNIMRRSAIDLPRSDVVHIKYRTGLGAHDLLGVPPLISCARSMGFVMRVYEAGSALYRNISLPSAVLSTDNVLNTTQIDDLRKRWEAHSKGSNLGGVVILTAGLKPSTMPVEKIIDAQLSEMQRATVLEITRAFGIPPQMAGETGSLNYSTSVELSRTFASLTLAPLATRVASEFDRVLLSPEQKAQGMICNIDLSDLLIGQGTERAEYCSKLINGGVATPNEMRDLIALPDLAADGDIIRVPLNTLPLGIWAKPPPKLSLEPSAAAPASRGYVTENLRRIRRTLDAR